MGWKGTVRSISAAARRMEKDAERRNKQALKEQMVSDASDDVADWENHIENLLTVHTDLSDRVDWTGMLKKKKPTEPKLRTEKQTAAKASLDNFKPSKLNFLKGGNAKLRKRLADEHERAVALDTNGSKLDLENYEKKLTDWQNDRALAERLLAGEDEAIKEVVTELQSLSETDMIGSYISFAIDDHYVHAKPTVHTDEIVPSYRRKQLASGKLSQTKMPVGQFNELYQDYVCSVALKVAGDLFQLLPLDEIYVTCQTEMLNTSTGHKEPTPILSVQFVRKTFEQLGLTAIDPSDSMANFNHIMSFKKTKGFSGIDPFCKTE